MIGWEVMKRLSFVLSMIFMSPFCLMCWQTQRISHHRRNRDDFTRKIKENRPNIELRWIVAEAAQGQRTTRAMWEGNEGVLLFTRIKSKRFLYWHTLNIPKPSCRAFPQGEPLLWTPAPLASVGSPTSVPGAVWASHKSGFCPHRTHRLHLNKKNEILLSHSSVWWLSCLSGSFICLSPSNSRPLVKTPSNSSNDSFLVTASF